MADSLTPAERSNMMARIKGKDTRPELVVRHILHAAGFRYRLHAKGLPGRPDIVLRSRKTLVFVNGCFWHGHDCHGTRLPKSNRRFWNAKIRANMDRDVRNLAECRRLGWRVLVVWECALQGKGRWSEERLTSEMSAWIGLDAKRASVRQIRGNPVA
jgi:DNA mismatch endonuclease (patch repair protein)